MLKYAINTYKDTGSSINNITELLSIFSYYNTTFCPEILLPSIGTILSLLMVNNLSSMMCFIRNIFGNTYTSMSDTFLCGTLHIFALFNILLANYDFVPSDTVISHDSYNYLCTKTDEYAVSYYYDNIININLHPRREKLLFSYINTKLSFATKLKSCNVNWHNNANSLIINPILYYKYEYEFCLPRFHLRLYRYFSSEFSVLLGQFYKLYVNSSIFKFINIAKAVIALISDGSRESILEFNIFFFYTDKLCIYHVSLYFLLRLPIYIDIYTYNFSIFSSKRFISYYHTRVSFILLDDVHIFVSSLLSNFAVVSVSYNI